MSKLSIFRLLRRILLLLIVYFCFRAVPLEIRAREKYQEVTRWPVTQASVQSASVSITNFSWSAEKARYCPDMQYSYSVADRTYTNRNQVFDFSCLPDAQEFVAKHGPGSSIPIAYDPSNPDTTVIPSSIVDAWLPWEDLLGGLFFLALLVVDLLAARPDAKT